MAKTRRAVISVYDKRGIVDFAVSLRKLGINIIATGGTFQLLKKRNIEVKEISDLISFPEILNGRVKSLHPTIYGGILARATKKDLEELKKHDIEPIDMVVVNLYPFKNVISKKNVKLRDAIENIDIGGLTLIRAGAKNFKRVAVITNPDRYDDIIKEMEEKGEISIETRRKLAVEAFYHTTLYDTTIYNYLYGKFKPDIIFPDNLILHYKKIADLRYGENKHQNAAFYSDEKIKEDCITNSKQLHGKKLSFNNILDINDAFELVKDFDEPTVAAIKHTNPCGVASDEDINKAYDKALAVDPVSTFGGIISLNRELTVPIAQKISKIFIEGVIAPNYVPDALKVLKRKKNLRIMESGGLNKSSYGWDLKKVVGGLLVQERDCKPLIMDDLKVVSERKPTKEEFNDLEFAWKVVRHVKSNAIIFSKNKVTVGIGAGQMSRVDAVKIAAQKSNGKSKGAVMASDAFFPFRDAIDEAAKTGITAVIQPGGSIRDGEVIKAVNEYKMAMVFTAQRAFKH